MNILTQQHFFENTPISSIEAFCKTYGLTSIAKRAGAYKAKGLGVKNILIKLISLVFMHKSMFMGTNDNSLGCCKDTFYRFINSTCINWLTFTTLWAESLINKMIYDLTNKDRVKVLIVDDTIYERNRSKKVELLSWVYDHTFHRFSKGFRLLSLGWSDGNTFIPVSGCLLSSSNPEKIISEERKFDKRSIAFKRRKMAQRKAPSVMLEMIQNALKSGIRASYLLFDSWFANPSTIISVLKEGLHVIAIVKKTTKVHYRYNGKMLPVTKIFKIAPRVHKNLNHISSCMVEMRPGKNSEKDAFVPARLVFVPNRNNRKEYLVLISTDLSLSEDEIIRIYGKRWDIEVFFKVCKSHLKLTDECRSTNYDAMSAYVAITWIRYTFLAVEKRTREEERSFEMLFQDTCEELQDITLTESLMILMNLFIQITTEFLSLTQEQLSQLLEKFFLNLPDSLKKKLVFSSR